MKTKILVSLLAMVFLAACTKDKYNTTPTITLESTSSKVVPFGGTLTVNLKITDKEGDISDTLYFKKIRRNIKTTATIRDSLTFSIPKAPDTKNGFLTLELQYENHLKAAINPVPVQNDTLTLQFVVRDKAKNKSAPVNIDNVIVIR